MFNNIMNSLRRRSFFFLLAFLPFILLLAYALVSAVAYVLPNADATGTYFLFICFIIVLALGVPYLLLKAGFHAAHMNNPRQKELKLEDLPKESGPPHVEA